MSPVKGFMSSAVYGERVSEVRATEHRYFPSLRRFGGLVAVPMSTLRPHFRKNSPPHLWRTGIWRFASTFIGSNTLSIIIYSLSRSTPVHAKPSGGPSTLMAVTVPGKPPVQASRARKPVTSMICDSHNNVSLARLRHNG